MEQGFEVEAVWEVMQHHTNAIIFISFVRRVFRIRMSRQEVRADSSVQGVGYLSFSTVSAVVPVGGSPDFLEVIKAVR